MSTMHDLRARCETAATNLRQQLDGLDRHLDRADAPGEWTTREVLCHLLFAPGFDPVALLGTFSASNLPLIEITSGITEVTPGRKGLTLRQLHDALEAQRRAVLEYLETLSATDLERKARIPIFKPLAGTDEISIPVFVGGMYDYHWNTHAGQLGKIRAAVGLPAAA
jgi:DinB family protein